MNGLAIAARNGARRDVVEWFALLHDSQRFNDGSDREHGSRAADFVGTLNREVLHLDALGLEMLAYACRYHSDGLTEADLTIQTCWDADRLDLARVGKRPDPARLCTEVAREPSIRSAAIRRSLR